MNNRRKHRANKLYPTVTFSTVFTSSQPEDIRTLKLDKCFPGSFAGPIVEETLPAPTLSTLATFSPPPPVPTTARSPVMPRRMTPCPWRTVVCKCFYWNQKVGQFHFKRFSPVNTFLGKSPGVWRKIFGLVVQQTQLFLGPGDYTVAK